jgi:hypothetical protein
MEEFTRMMQASQIDLDQNADRMMTLDYDAVQACQKLSTAEATFFRERLAVLEKAHLQFSMRAAMGQSNFNYERLYQKLHDDILKHETYWFKSIFPLQGLDNKYTERTVGILGTLATMLRQRGEVKKAQKILTLDRRVLERYQAQTRLVPHNKPQVFCCDVLTYKFHLIAVNAETQLGNKIPAVASFREAVKFEIEQQYSFEQQNLGFMLCIALPNLESGDYMTLQCLSAVTDDRIWEIMLQGQTFQKTPPSPDVLLRDCSLCHATEQKRGDYQTCSRCKVVHYCGKECQKKDWRLHKRVCVSPGAKK